MVSLQKVIELWRHKSLLKIKNTIFESVTAIAVFSLDQNNSILKGPFGGF